MQFVKPIHFFTFETDARKKLKYVFRFYTKDCVMMHVESDTVSVYFDDNQSTNVANVCHDGKYKIHFMVNDMHHIYTIPSAFKLFKQTGDTISSAIEMVKEMLGKYMVVFVEVLPLFLHKDIIIIIHELFLLDVTPKKMIFGDKN